MPESLKIFRFSTFKLKHGLRLHMVHGVYLGMGSLEGLSVKTVSVKPGHC